MTGFIIALIMVLITLIAMVMDLTDLRKQVKVQTRDYNELKKRL